MHDGAVAAYVLYDLPRDEIRIVQLVVAPAYRHRELARDLVDEIASEHAHRRGIFLSCRNDFEADGLWPRLDFVPLRERPGRSLDGKPLTRWFRSFGQPDLFTVLHEQDARPVAVMDACVFFDVVARHPKPLAQQLRADWLVEHVRFAVTNQVLVEIHRGSDADERARETAAADPLLLPSSATVRWRTIYDAIRAAHPRAPETDRDDLKHIAQAIAAEATWLITTDRRFVRRYGATAERLGRLRLVLASAFLREIDEIARSDRYRPIDLAGTAVTRREATATALSDLAQEFVNHRAGERVRDLRHTIENAAGDPLGFRLELVEVDATRRGLICWERSDESIDVLAVRVIGGAAEATIGRHLLAIARDEAAAGRVPTIRLLDERPSPGVRRSLRDEGFALAQDHDDRVIAHTLHGAGTLDELHERAIALGSPLAGTDLFAPNQENLVDRAAAAERWFAPFVVIGAGIPTFFVPIQHGWATDLIDTGLAEQQLLYRPWQLGLRRELVYYRSPRNSGGLTAPARLVWYVSGRSPGAGSIRAVSHLTEVITDAHHRLYHRFERLGVYRADDVARVADANGMAMAMRFTSTRRVDPIPLDEYREMLTGDPKSKNVVLRSVRPLSEHVFVSLVGLRHHSGA
jgi:hypothetical protein